MQTLTVLGHKALGASALTLLSAGSTIEPKAATGQQPGQLQPGPLTSGLSGSESSIDIVLQSKVGTCMHERVARGPTLTGSNHM